MPDTLRYYNSNSNLKAANIKLDFTQDQVKEYLLCAEDPVYFIDNYCKIVTLDNGLQPFKLYPCQINKVKVIHENRKVILMEGRQQGKCCKNSTRINIRNKVTGDVRSVTVEEFHEMSRHFKIQHKVVTCSRHLEKSNQYLKLSDLITRKFTETFDVSEWQVETEEGYADIISSNKTVEYEVYRIKLDSGLYLECADDHILITSSGEEVFAKDSIGIELITKIGPSRVVSVESLGYYEPMYDLSVDSENHTYFTNDILSHNTTTSAAYILWYTLFQSSKTVAILANKAAAAREVLHRYQLMYENLPKWLQQGVTTWNKGDIELENRSIVFTAATSASGIRGKSVNLLYVDETAIIPNTVAEQFFTSVYPTISAGETTKILLSSTPLGYNHFWKFWNDAQNNRNGFVPLFIPYWEIPGRDEKWAEEQRRLLGDLKFNQEVICSFLGSSLTLINADTIASLSPSPAILSKDGLDIYEKPIKEIRSDGVVNQRAHSYVMVVDTAKGVGGDYSAFTIIDISQVPYKLVGKYRDNRISPMLYPSIIHKVAKEYNDAYVLIEINSSEQVASILHEEYEYENILFVNRGSSGQVVSAGFGGGKTQLGVLTDRKVKRVGCTTLKSLVEEKKLLLPDADVISEISTFIETKGSYAADDGYNDDLVMTLVLFGWLTSNPYFKDLSDINIRQVIYQNRIKMIEEELTPFGFFNDGSAIEDRDNSWL